MNRRPPSPTLFPYTTLFRSRAQDHPQDADGRQRPMGAERAEQDEELPDKPVGARRVPDRKSTRLNSSHTVISYAVFCLKKKKERQQKLPLAARPPRPAARPR